MLNQVVSQNEKSQKTQKIIEEKVHIAVEVEVDDSYFQDVDILVEHGISSNDVEKLKAMGINTVKGVEMTTRKQLTLIQGFDDAKIDKIKIACCKLSLENAFSTASEISEQRKQIFRLSTGSKNLE